MSVASSTGFPTPGTNTYFYATIVRISDAAIEIIKVTNISGTTWTITRAQEGTTALTFVTGDKVELRMTAAAHGDGLFGRLVAIHKFSATTYNLWDLVTGANTTPAFTNGTTTFSPLYANSARAVIEGWGGGGGTYGLAATSASQVSIASNGADGGYGRVLATITSINANTITVGTGGSAGTSGGGAGGAGGATNIATTTFYGGNAGNTTGLVSTFPAMVSTPVGATTSGSIVLADKRHSAGTIVAHSLTTYSLPTKTQDRYGSGGNPVINLASAAAVAGNSGTDGALFIYEYA